MHPQKPPVREEFVQDALEWLSEREIRGAGLENRAPLRVGFIDQMFVLVQTVLQRHEIRCESDAYSDYDGSPTARLLH